MGIITSRIPIPFFQKKTPEIYRKELEEINKNILELEQGRRKLHLNYAIIEELITTYSRLLYGLLAIVFFFSRSPSTFFQYILFFGSLVVFYTLVYLVRVGLKWYYEYELVSNVDKIKRLQFKKKGIIAKVKETAQFKEAKEILDEYGPEKPVRSKSPCFGRNVTSRNPTQCLDNILSYVLQEKKANALICLYCKGHNGMALEEECDYMGFRCYRCRIMNPPRKIRQPNTEACDSSNEEKKVS